MFVHQPCTAEWYNDAAASAKPSYSCLTLTGGFYFLLSRREVFLFFQIHIVTFTCINGISGSGNCRLEALWYLFIASGRREAAFLYGKVTERFRAFQVYRVREFMSSYLKVSNAKSWPALRILMIQSFKMLKKLTLSLQMMKYPINQCFHIVW